MAFKIPIRGIGTQIHYFDEFAVLTFYFKAPKIVTVITRELYIVDDLKTKMLFCTDIMTPEKMNLNFGSQQMIIGSCQGLSIPFFYAGEQPNFKRTVRFKTFIVLLPGVPINVPVNYYGQIPVDRDFFFEPQFNFSYHLGNNGKMFVYIVDVFLNFVQIYNATILFVTIPKRTKLNSVIEYNQEKCFLVDFSTNFKLIFTGWKSKTIKIVKSAIMAAVFLAQFSKHARVNVSSSSTFIAIFIAVDPFVEHVMFDGIIVYRNFQAAIRFASLFDAHQNVFVDIGITMDVPEDQWMPIKFKPNENFKLVRVYPLS